MGGTVSSRCAAPPLRSGPSGDTAPPMAKRVATAGRVLPAIAGPACHGARWIAGGRQRLPLVARCDVERDGEQVGPTRPEPVEPHRPARPYPCAGGRARISSGPGSDSPPAQRPDICVHPTPPPRGDTPLQSGADHICGRPRRSPRFVVHPPATVAQRGLAVDVRNSASVNQRAGACRFATSGANTAQTLSSRRTCAAAVGCTPSSCISPSSDSATPSSRNGTSAAPVASATSS